MIELIREEDFDELPEEADQKWIKLELLARHRFLDHRSDSSGLISDADLIAHYMHIVSQLAETYEVKSMAVPNGSSPEGNLHNFQLSVSRARARILAAGLPTYPLGRVALAASSKKAILDLTAEIEAKIHDLDESDKRKRAYFARLEEFRREINQPKTRIGTALTTLAQISTIVAMNVTGFAQAPDAFATIQAILGAEQAEASGTEIYLIEKEKLLLLTSPPKQIENKMLESGSDSEKGP